MNDPQESDDFRRGVIVGLDKAAALCDFHGVDALRVHLARERLWMEREASHHRLSAENRAWSLGMIAYLEETIAEKGATVRAP